MAGADHDGTVGAVTVGDVDVRGMDPRLDPTLVGGVLFLASELMFFTGLFAGWFMLKAQTTPWPPAGVDLGPAIPAAATVVIVLAAVAAQLGADRSRSGWLGLCGLAGLAFCALTVWDWARSGLGIGDHAYASLYYAMTGLHLVHVVVGVAICAVVLLRLRATEAGISPKVLRVTAWYMWWVAAVWVAMFGVVYLIG